jgi:hypothetical protein
MADLGVVGGVFVERDFADVPPLPDNPRARHPSASPKNFGFSIGALRACRSVPMRGV